MCDRRVPFLSTQAVGEFLRKGFGRLLNAMAIRGFRFYNMHIINGLLCCVHRLTISSDSSSLSKLPPQNVVFRPFIDNFRHRLYITTVDSARTLPKSTVLDSHPDDQRLVSASNPLGLLGLLKADHQCSRQRLRRQVPCRGGKASRRSGAPARRTGSTRRAASTDCRRSFSERLSRSRDGTRFRTFPILRVKRLRHPSRMTGNPLLIR